MPEIGNVESLLDRPEGYEAIATPRSGQKTFEALDHAINTILEECYTEAKRIISERRDAMERVTQNLLQKETLTREEFEVPECRNTPALRSDSAGLHRVI